MTDLSDVASLAVVAGLLTIIPGLDTALVIRTAVTQGRSRAFAVALGIMTGILIWGAAAAVGISALLVASRLAYDAIRVAGAIYLACLGVTMILRTRRVSGTARDDAARHGGAGCPAVPPRPTEDAFRCWLRGTTTNLLNPKIGVFYVAILPQFIPTHAPHLLMGLALAGVHDAEGIIWFTTLISAVHLGRRFLDSNAARKIMDRVTGLVLVGFGVKLALSSR